MKFQVITTKQQRVLFTAWELGTRGAIAYRKKHGDAFPTIRHAMNIKGVALDRVKRGIFDRRSDADSFAHLIEAACAYQAGRLGKTGFGSVRVAPAQP